MTHCFRLVLPHWPSLRPAPALSRSRHRGSWRAGRRATSRGAEFFLARTGELRLTDGQVVRLARGAPCRGSTARDASEHGFAGIRPSCGDAP